MRVLGQKKTSWGGAFGGERIKSSPFLDYEMFTLQKVGGKDSLRSESVMNARNKLKTIDLMRIDTHIVYHAHRINTW